MQVQNARLRMQCKLKKSLITKYHRANFNSIQKITISKNNLSDITILQELDHRLVSNSN